jgi:hypothetical protein
VHSDKGWQSVYIPAILLTSGIPNRRGKAPFDREYGGVDPFASQRPVWLPAAVADEEVAVQEAQVEAFWAEHEAAKEQEAKVRLQAERDRVLEAERKEEEKKRQEEADKQAAKQANTLRMAEHAEAAKRQHDAAALKEAQEIEGRHSAYAAGVQKERNQRRAEQTKLALAEVARTKRAEDAAGQAALAKAVAANQVIVRRERAFTRLQALTRGALTRKKNFKRGEMVTKIQALVRGVAARVRYPERAANGAGKGGDYHALLANQLTDSLKPARVSPGPLSVVAQELALAGAEMTSTEEGVTGPEGAPLRPLTVLGEQLARSPKPRAVAKAVDYRV